MKMRVISLFLALFMLSFLLFGILHAESGNKSLSNQPAPTAPADTTPGNLIASQAAPLLTNPIHIVEPAENAHLPALSSTFVCGSVPAGGVLSINGLPVPVHPGGGFLAMAQLSPGEFHINADLQFGDQIYHLTRTVVVAGSEQPLPVSPLAIEYVSPRQDQELLPGDDVEVVCKGSPGQKAYFRVKGVRKRFPMIESEAGSGIYQGVYLVGNKDRLKKSPLKVTLVNPANQKVSKKTDGTLSLFPNDVPEMVETISPDVVLRAGPALTPDDKAGYMMFPPLGTVLQVTGRKGDEYRVRLTKTKTAWVSINQVKQLPEGTAPLNVVVGSIGVGTAELSTKIRIPLSRKIPFKIDPDVEGNHIDISLYGAFSNTDLISNVSTGAIKSIRWYQDDEETYRLQLLTAPGGWWGYDARYEGNNLVLELRAPRPLTTGDSVLSGLIIAVDAGHGAGGGAMGVTGYAEGDANMAMALNLKEKLLAKGAQVIFTRTGGLDVPLSERPRIAWQNKADLLVSLHNNSCGYGGNPLKKHGFGVYYFTPMSLSLAKDIHAAYGGAFGPGGAYQLPDDGLYYDNLALTRAPQMPSILIESAYMIVPEEEAYLKTDGFRSACSDAIISGLESYVRSMRPLTNKEK